MLKLKELYKSDINRPIQNVIKISDDQNLVKQELEEYVLTKELKAHFNTFFSSYNKSINNSTDEIGVWISGFYGSGKSHLLKIISYLLDNAKTIDDKYAGDYFNDKINDSMLLEDIKRAGNVSADIILFNISSVAGVDTVTGVVGTLVVGALVGAFVGAFVGVFVGALVGAFVGALVLCISAAARIKQKTLFRKSAVYMGGKKP